MKLGKETIEVNQVDYTLFADLTVLFPQFELFCYVTMAYSNRVLKPKVCEDDILDCAHPQRKGERKYAVRDGDQPRSDDSKMGKGECEGGGSIKV